jgi:hypothetical protein
MASKTEILKITMSDINPIKWLFEQLNNFRPELLLVLKKEIVTKSDSESSSKKKGGIIIKVFDSTKSVFSCISINSSFFDVFYLVKSMSVGIKISDFLTILKSVCKNDEISLQMNSDKRDTFVINIVNNVNETSQIDRIKLIEEINKDSYSYKEDYDTTIEFNTEEFNSLCRIMDSVGSTIEFICTKTTFTAKCINETSRSEKEKEYKINGKLIKIIQFTKDTPIIKSKCELKFLLNVTNRAHIINAHLLLQFKKGYPINIRISSPEFGKLSYFISKCDEIDESVIEDLNLIKD